MDGLYNIGKINVQPMTVPTSKIFFMEFSYVTSPADQGPFILIKPCRWRDIILEIEEDNANNRPNK